MKDEYAKLLRHMLGADENTKKSNHGYRNHYCCASRDNADTNLLWQLERIGLVYSSYRQNQLFFHATKSGAMAIGLNKAALIRAELIEKKEAVS